MVASLACGDFFSGHLPTRGLHCPASVCWACLIPPHAQIPSPCVQASGAGEAQSGSLICRLGNRTSLKEGQGTNSRLSLHQGWARPETAPGDAEEAPIQDRR